jgi:PAS domain S-box-containing protein
MNFSTLDSMTDLRATASSADDLAALYKLTDRLYRAESLDQVYAAALDAIGATLGCNRASILLFDDHGRMRFVAWRGLSSGYRAAVDGHSPWACGDTAAEPILVPDIAETGEPEVIKAAIMAEGIRSLSFVPLMVRGRVAGKFMTYHATRHDFSQREIELAVLIARQVGFSLERAVSDRDREAAEEALRRQERRSRQMLENAPVMIWTSDANGHCEHLNRMLRDFWGVSESEIATFDWSSTIHPDDSAAVGAAMMDAIARRQGVCVRGRYRNAKGEYRVLLTDAQPRFSDDGAFVGMIGVNVDMTEREENENALRQSEERFRLVVEAAPSGMIITNETGEIVLVNAKAENLFGCQRQDLMGASIEDLVPERARLSHASFRNRLAMQPGDIVDGADRVVQARRRDGSEFPAEIGLSHIQSPSGPLYLASVVDISERIRAQAQRDVLLAELNHRVKNTLALVQGIAQQTFKGTATEPAAKRAFEGRLHALAVAHNMLTRTNWSYAPLAQLVSDTLGPGLVGSGRVRCEGPPMLLDPKSSLAVTMALHELLTNAIKYGALSIDSGRVRVTWQAAGDPSRFVLEWVEAGGPPVSVPTRTGFGSRLVQRILADDLAGSVDLDFRPEGVACRIEGSLRAAAGATP